MDETRIINKVELRGTVKGRPQFSHESRGERFYQVTMEIERLSGASDNVNVIAREPLLDLTELNSQSKLTVLGELRSFNNKSGVGSRLVITVFAREMSFGEGPDENKVTLTGTLCKPPNLRTTPMGREISDLMVAVNRRYGRSDYLPCIAWGLRAKEAAEWSIGTPVTLEGRIQSRNYIKNVDGVPEEKTAFEVSIIEISPIDALPGATARKAEEFGETGALMAALDPEPEEREDSEQLDDTETLRSLYSVSDPEDE